MGSTTAKALGYGPCVTRGSVTQFYLPPTHETYPPLLPSRKASPPFGWYSLHLPTKGWLGWVDLGGWLHTEINVPDLELNLDTVTHVSTNQADLSITGMCHFRLACATFDIEFDTLEMFNFRLLHQRFRSMSGICLHHSFHHCQLRRQHYCSQSPTNYCSVLYSC